MTHLQELGTRGTAWTPETRLYSDGVVVGMDGGPLVVPPGSGLRRVPGTGLLDVTSGSLPGAAVVTPEQVHSTRERLGTAEIPGAGTPYAAMAREALVDIHVLTFPNGAAVAAGSPYWRYVWPRDAGFMAAALAVAGRHVEAARVLGYVASMQEKDGGWEARYLPDGSGDVPDSRGRQLDGIGWSLWAAWVCDRTGGAADAFLPMVRAGITAALDSLDPRTHLPRASQDFWEMDVDEATLGTAAPLLLALRCGRDLLSDDEPELARRSAQAARDLAGTIRERFGAHGYNRRLSGHGGRDASVAFLLPPFGPEEPAVLDAWRAAMSATAVSNGGVRPGEEWSDHSTAWTPQVSLYALTAAATGDHGLAHRLLSWLDLRRTTLGCLPEKITADGRPAAVAPLGLTGATVLLALAALDGRTLPVPRAETPAAAIQLQTRHR